MVPKIERIIDIENNQLGEGPHWDADTQSLYFVDINGHSIHKYVPSTKKHTKAVLGNNVSIIIPVKEKTDQFVITLGREIVLISWNGENDNVSIIKKLYAVDPNTENVFNDGKCDPSGRLWTGTMGAAPVNLHIPDGKGTLYSFKNNKVTPHLTGIGISNGLAFNTDLKKLYYIDSYKGVVNQYDFDIENGTISNQTPIFTLNKNGIEGLPDGMAMDADGNLWVAVFNASSVIKINPRYTETILQTIELPSRQITSVAFGGQNLNELYVTSGRIPLDGSVLAPEDGAVYKVSGLNVKGLPGEKIVL